MFRSEENKLADFGEEEAASSPAYECREDIVVFVRVRVRPSTVLEPIQVSFLFISSFIVKFCVKVSASQRFKASLTSYRIEL